MPPQPPRSKQGRWWAALAAALGLGLLLWLRAPSPAGESAEAAAGAHDAAPAAHAAASAPRAPAERPSVAAPAPGVAGPQGGALEGRVLSTATGHPVPGAEVTFQRDDGANTVHTDALGRYRFSPGQPGTYRLAAVAADGFLPFAPAWGRSPLKLVLEDGVLVQGVDFRLSPGVAYLVRVVDREEQPVEGALVQLRPPRSGEGALLPPPPVRTGPSGEASLLLPDDAFVDASKGTTSGSAWLSFSERVTHRVQIMLMEPTPRREPEPGTQKVLGRVVDVHGAPIDGALVWVLQQAATPDKQLSTVVVKRVLTGSDGTFHADGLRPGTTSLKVTADGYQTSEEIFVEPDTEAVIKLAANEGTLSGRVFDAQTGRPVVSFVLALRRPRGPLRTETELSRAFIDPEGRYELTALGPGDAVIVAAAAGYAPSEQPHYLFAGANKADVGLRAGASVQGVVLDAKSRAPLEGARVTVEGQRGESTAPVLRVDATTDAAGAFTLAGLAEGALTLVVSAEGHHGRLFAVPAVPREGTAPEQTVLLTPLAEGETPKVEFTGIGVSLSADGEALRIGMVAAGSGAAEAGLQPGDRILRIDGRPVTEVGFEPAMSLIRGPEGSTVLLLVQRGEAAAADVRVVRKPLRN